MSAKPAHQFLSGACLALLLFGWIANAFAQEKPQLRDFGSSLKKDSKKKVESQTVKPTSGDDDIVRVETDLVTSDVMVVDDKGKAILGLDRQDFIVTEDGTRQEIGTFSLGDAPAIPRSNRTDYRLQYQPASLYQDEYRCCEDLG